MKRIIPVGPLLLALTLPAGCVSIGPSSPKLSAEVGSRIAEMQGLHETALRSVFDDQRRRIEEFIDHEWVPLFLKNFLAKSNIVNQLNANTSFGDVQRGRLSTAIATHLSDPEEADLATQRLVARLDQSRGGEEALIRGVLGDFVEDARMDGAVRHVVSLLSTEEPGLMIMEWAEAAHIEIDRQRRKMLAPLDDAEAEAFGELATAYAELVSAQGLITARLETASKATAEQDAMLARVGASDTFAGLKSKLASVSSSVGSALNEVGDVDPNANPKDVVARLASGLLSRLGSGGQ